VLQQILVQIDVPGKPRRSRGVPGSISRGVLALHSNSAHSCLACRGSGLTFVGTDPTIPRGSDRPHGSRAVGSVYSLWSRGVGLIRGDTIPRLQAEVRPTQRLQREQTDPSCSGARVLVPLHLLGKVSRPTGAAQTSSVAILAQAVLRRLLPILPASHAFGG